MNRRRVLQAAGALATVGLAGCLEGVQEHFGLQGVVPVEIYSEADQPHNVQLAAQERETGRETYEEAYSVTPNETVAPPNMERTAQSMRVVKFDENDEQAIVRAVSITDQTELVRIYIYDDDLVVEVDGPGGETDIEGGDELDGNETIDEDAAHAENETAADTETDDEPDSE